jgi:hypothetical protein
MTDRAAPFQPGELVAAGRADQLTLPRDSLRLLARRYPARLEVGWWRTLAALSEFSTRPASTSARNAYRWRAMSKGSSGPG